MNGNFEGGKQTLLDKSDTEIGCKKLVQRKEPNAIGVTYGTNTKECWAVYGAPLKQDDISDEWISCFFKGT